MVETDQFKIHSHVGSSLLELWVRKFIVIIPEISKNLLITYVIQLFSSQHGRVML